MLLKPFKNEIKKTTYIYILVFISRVTILHVFIKEGHWYGMMYFFNTMNQSVISVDISYLVVFFLLLISVRSCLKIM